MFINTDDFSVQITMTSKIDRSKRIYTLQKPESILQSIRHKEILYATTSGGIHVGKVAFIDEMDDEIRIVNRTEVTTIRCSELLGWCYTDGFIVKRPGEPGYDHDEDEDEDDE